VPKTPAELRRRYSIPLRGVKCSKSPRATRAWREGRKSGSTSSAQAGTDKFPPIREPLTCNRHHSASPARTIAGLSGFLIFSPPRDGPDRVCSAASTRRPRSRELPQGRGIVPSRRKLQCAAACSSKFVPWTTPRWIANGETGDDQRRALQMLLSLFDDHTSQKSLNLFGASAL
jgi:hypothetical protein